MNYEFSIPMLLPCPLYQLTGWQCPFCGVQRGIIALMHGEVAEWWNYNPVVWCLTPYFLLFIISEIYRPWLEKPFFKWIRQDKVIFSVMGLLLLWSVVRNFF